MILTTRDPQIFEEKKAAKVADLKEWLISLQQQHLRVCFNKTSLDSTAQACIQVAKELGFDKLASDMEIDFALERELVI